MTDLSDIWTLISGAVIAGLVGVAVVLFQQWYADRRRFEADTLGPAYSYVASIPRDCTWQNLPDPPWKEVDPYSWQKIPAKYRLPFQELSTRLVAYSATYNRWSEFAMSGGGWAGFAESIRNVLPYLSSDKMVVVLQPTESDAKVTHDVHAVASGLVPYVLSNKGDPGRAWQLLEAGPSTVFPSKQVVRILQASDPGVLQKMFDAVLQNGSAPKAANFVESMRESYARVAEQAHTLKVLLADRLGFEE